MANTFTQRQKKLPKAIRKEDWEKLIKVIPAKDRKALVAFLLAYGSGMRVSEVVRCAPEHIRENKSIFIPESKYGIERVVPLPKGWRKDFIKVLPIAKSMDEKGVANAVRLMQFRFTKYKKKSGINPTLTFHSLRHGFATRLLENGVPINQVSLALGHADISTTSIYTRASATDLLAAYEEKF